MTVVSRDEERLQRIKQLYERLMPVVSTHVRDKTLREAIAAVKIPGDPEDVIEGLVRDGYFKRGELFPPTSLVQVVGYQRTNKGYYLLNPVKGKGVLPK